MTNQPIPGSRAGAASARPQAPPASAPGPRKPPRSLRPGPRVHLLDRMTLSFKLVSIVILVTLLAECVLGLAVRQLIARYILERTDSQLTQQAQLVFDNYQQLLYNTPGSANYLLTDYFLQVRDTDGDVIATMSPSQRDGIISEPDLDSYDLSSVGYSEPFTVPAKITYVNGAASGDISALSRSWRVEAFRIVQPQQGQQQNQQSIPGTVPYDQGGQSSDESSDGQDGDDGASDGGSDGQGSTDGDTDGDGQGAASGASASLGGLGFEVIPAGQVSRGQASQVPGGSPVVSSSGSDNVIGTAYIGLSLRDMYETTTMVTRYTAAAGVCTLIAAGILAAMFVRSTLRPLKRMEKTAAKIAAGDLSERVPTLPANTEIGSLANSLNAMLSQIERSFKEQEETNSKMKQFVSDASHELRTPLATIHGYAELYRMQRAVDPDDATALAHADDAIEHIETSSTRMADLVEDLLSLTRLDEGRGVKFARDVDVAELIGDSAEDLHALDPEREISIGSATLVTADAGDATGEAGDGPALPRFDVSSQPLAPMSITGDSMRLHQVLTNIIGNIHRYTPARSPVEIGATRVHAPFGQDLGAMPSVEESLLSFTAACAAAQAPSAPPAAQARDFAVIVVRDHGPGLTREQRNRIFERFYTADPSRARLKGGTGLGMAIVESIVKAHHGLICPTATPGGGLSYTIVLPVEQPASLTAVTPNGQGGAAARGATTDTKSAASEKTPPEKPAGKDRKGGNPARGGIPAASSDARRKG